MTRRANTPAKPQSEARAPRRSEPSPGVLARPQPVTHTRPQPGAAPQLAGTAALIMLALIVVAATVHLTAPAIARRLLSFAFPARPPGLGAAWGILTDNLRLAAAPLTGALLLQIANRDSGAFKPRRALLDAIIATILGLNVVIVGAGFGGYGAKIVRYTLPHGPVELAGYCCALTVYITARTGRLQTRQAWLLASASVVLLTVAAMFEAVASPI
jgi:hypothetical protein